MRCSKPYLLFKALIPIIGAKDLRECLKIQLDKMGERKSLAYEIVENYLEELARGKWNTIANKLGVSLVEVQTASDRIRSLDPLPGLQYGPHHTEYIIPDVTVELVKGNYMVTMNDTLTPQLNFHRFYDKLLYQDQQVKTYIQNKYQSAKWLLKSIEQRQLTIYRVMEAIVEQQQPFLEKGVAYLKPMTLKEMADRLEMHESTMSRATRNKYVQTPRGLFPLSYFFTSGFSTIQGDTTSSESVKGRLKRYIEEENSTQPLSDQKISERFLQDGIVISRRTVAKYREELGILSSPKRKRYS